MEKKFVVIGLAKSRTYKSIEEAASAAKKFANKQNGYGEEYGVFELIGYTKTPDPAIEFIAVT